MFTNHGSITINNLLLDAGFKLMYKYGLNFITAINTGTVDSGCFFFTFNLNVIFFKAAIILNTYNCTRITFKKLRTFVLYNR